AVGAEESINALASFRERNKAQTGAIVEHAGPGRELGLRIGGEHPTGADAGRNQRVRHNVVAVYPYAALDQYPLSRRPAVLGVETGFHVAPGQGRKIQETDAAQQSAGSVEHKRSVAMG